MDIDPARLTDAPATLLELLSSVLLAAILVFAALRIQTRRWLIVSVACGVAAAVVLLLIANVIGRFGLDWHGSRTMAVSDRGVDRIVTGSLLMVTAGTEAYLIRKWRRLHAQPTG